MHVLLTHRNKLISNIDLFGNGLRQSHRKLISNNHIIDIYLCVVQICLDSMKSHSMMTSSNGNIFFAVPGDFPAQRPVTRSFDVFFDLCPNKGWINNREADDLRRHRAHYDVIVMHYRKKKFCVVTSSAFDRRSVEGSANCTSMDWEYYRRKRCTGQNTLSVGLMLWFINIISTYYLTFVGNLLCSVQNKIGYLFRTITLRDAWLL